MRIQTFYTGVVCTVMFNSIEFGYRWNISPPRSLSSSSSVDIAVVGIALWLVEPDCYIEPRHVSRAYV